MFCFLGMIVFPMKKARIHTRLAMVTKTLMEGIGGQPFSIVPMIVAEIYRALDNCQRKQVILRDAIYYFSSGSWSTSRKENTNQRSYAETGMITLPSTSQGV